MMASEQAAYLWLSDAQTLEQLRVLDGQLNHLQ